MGGKWLDTQLAVNLPIPHDIDQTGIEGETTLLYDPLAAYDRRDGKPIDNNGALLRILRNTDIDILLRTIGNAFFPRVVTIGTSPTLLIAPNRTPRGYTIINPNSSSSGVVTTSTVFPAATVFPIGTTNSASITVEAHGGAAFFLDVTAIAGGTTSVSINLQTQDPVSGNWADAQTDIFSFGGGIPSPVPGTFYANVGGIGIDQFARLQVICGGGTLTASIGVILKPGVAGAVGGPSVFLGGPDVNTTIGFPLLSGTKETFYLKENTALYGVAVAATNINVFELQ